MKKFLVVFASLGLALSVMAQDFNEAVETFNQAAQAESKAEALNLFKQAYTQFVACGEEAEAQDKVEELKDIIPAYSVAVAKEIIAAKEGGPSRDWLNAELGYLASPRARRK